MLAWVRQTEPMHGSNPEICSLGPDHLYSRPYRVSAMCSLLALFIFVSYFRLVLAYSSLDLEVGGYNPGANEPDCDPSPGL